MKTPCTAAPRASGGAPWEKRQRLWESCLFSTFDSRSLEDHWTPSKQDTSPGFGFLTLCSLFKTARVRQISETASIDHHSMHPKSVRGGQGLLGKLKHLLGGGGGCLGIYGCSKDTSMVFFRGPPLDVSFLAYTRLVVLSQPCLPLLGLGLGQGHTIALHKGKQ